jgi:hypothetical protein
MVGRGWRRIDHEVVALTDRKTVQAWVRELRTEHDVTLLVHRFWGTVAAVADGHSVAVLMSDGEEVWTAEIPGMGQDLTLDQIEHVILDALDSPGPPAWPDWRKI